MLLNKKLLYFFVNIFLLANSFIHNNVFKNAIKISSDINHENIGIIFFPGYGKNAESYRSINEKICNKLTENNIGSTIIINNYLKNLPIAGDIQSKLLTEYSINLINENKNIDKIFFIGHSAGSYFLNNIASEYGCGFIQLGNVLNSNGLLPWEQNSLFKYPIPVLTIVGQKDGYINPFYIKDELENIKYINNTIEKPVIIEKNINHLQVSDNIETKFAKIINKKDILSPIELNEAQDIISETISEFITCCLNKTHNSSILEKKIKRTKNIIYNYKAKECDINKFAENIQYDILNPLFIIDIPIKNRDYNNKISFVNSKPFIDENGTIYTSSFRAKNGIDNRFYSDIIWLKMKNQEAFNSYEKYNTTNLKKTKSAYEINKEIFDKILYEIKSQEEILKGPKVIFQYDDVFENSAFVGLKWINTNIEINYDRFNNIIYIKSPVLYTSMSIYKKYAGMYYTKLLSPQLCYELIQMYF